MVEYALGRAQLAQSQVATLLLENSGRCEDRPGDRAVRPADRSRNRHCARDHLRAASARGNALVDDEAYRGSIIDQGALINRLPNRVARADFPEVQTRTTE